MCACTHDSTVDLIPHPSPCIELAHAITDFNIIDIVLIHAVHDETPTAKVLLVKVYL